jgi:hypothetical protein
MRIALDYDQTFTVDEFFWRQVVDLAKQRGHSVSFVTFRKEAGNNLDIIADAENLKIPIVFCNYKQKASVTEADVWIDDSPRYIPTADEIKYQCETYDLAFELRYPPRKTDPNYSYDTKPGQSYKGTVNHNGVMELFHMDGNPVAKKPLVWRSK